ncbi:AAA family ATPase [Streptomyces sp. SBT349]|uniref:AAA family ATPase n=1 Tax=Streptomyces sp. SBT349 TaxID=1580539 RepID=UPI0018FE7E80|nr:AAA family ATPase [Streptomyces sp. SBT349]
MATLLQRGRLLAEGVPWLIDLHLRRLEKHPGADELLTGVMALLRDGLLPEEYQISAVSSHRLWVAKGAEQPYPLREMSDGYRTVAALVLDIARQIHDAYDGLDTVQTGDGGLAVTAPGVVLIDDVGAHLHVTWQRRIGD